MVEWFAEILRVHLQPQGDQVDDDQLGNDTLLVHKIVRLVAEKQTSLRWVTLRNWFIFQS